MSKFVIDPRRLKPALFLFLGLTLLFLASPVHAQMGKGTADFTAWNLVKIASMENSICGKAKDITIYVMDDPEVASQLSSDIGKSIGKATLKNVESGSTLPSTPPDIIFIGDADKYITDPTGLKRLVDYTRENKILSVTYEPILVYKGITLAIGNQGGAPKFLLNLRASKEEGLDWNKAVIKLAETI